jgi:hypothetical protein
VCLLAWRLYVRYAAGQLRDDHVAPPDLLVSCGDPLSQVGDLITQSLNERSTVYLSLTSSLRPAVVQLH